VEALYIIKLEFLAFMSIMDITDLELPPDDNDSFPDLEYELEAERREDGDEE
jgi:hypothetical protein